VGESCPRLAGHLTVARIAAELYGDFVHLTQTRGADRLAVRETAAVGVHRQAAADPRRAIVIQLDLLAVLAQSALCEVNELGARLRILDLRNVDVVGRDAC
jgi:hypothetical protein